MPVLLISVGLLCLLPMVLAFISWVREHGGGGGGDGDGDVEGLIRP